MTHHGAGLRRIGNGNRDLSEVERVIAALEDTTCLSGEFNSAELVLLAYADRLTLDPSAVNSGDVEALRAEGFDDRAIHDACAIVSYFAFVNRIADGLGVELESP